MPTSSYPRWFATPNGDTLYALISPERWVEHQRMGGHYQRYEMEVKTYADRLHVAALEDRLASGELVSMGEVEYQEQVRHIERLKRLG